MNEGHLGVDDHALARVPRSARYSWWSVAVQRFGQVSALSQFLLGSTLGFGMSFWPAVLGVHARGGDPGARLHRGRHHRRPRRSADVAAHAVDGLRPRRQRRRRARDRDQPHRLVRHPVRGVGRGAGEPGRRAAGVAVVAAVRPRGHARRAVGLRVDEVGRLRDRAGVPAAGGLVDRGRAARPRRRGAHREPATGSGTDPPAGHHARRGRLHRRCRDHARHDAVQPQRRRRREADGARVHPRRVPDRHVRRAAGPRDPLRRHHHHRHVVGRVGRHAGDHPGHPEDQRLEPLQLRPRPGQLRRDRPGPPGQPGRRDALPRHRGQRAGRRRHPRELHRLPHRARRGVPADRRDHGRRVLRGEDLARRPGSQSRRRERCPTAPRPGCRPRWSSGSSRPCWAASSAGACPASTPWSRPSCSTSWPASSGWSAGSASARRPTWPTRCRNRPDIERTA